MSKYLGFIHFIMFDKIKFQNEIVNDILELANENGYEDIVKETNSIGIIEDGRLEDIIEGDNIHGWLQQRVELVEEKFAFVVNSLIKKDSTMKDKIFNKLYELGKKEEFNSNAHDAFELINSRFLDGMPCDRAIALVEESTNNIKFKVDVDCHSKFWDENNIYWDLRNEYIKGLIDNSNLELFVLEDNIYEIR